MSEEILMPYEFDEQINANQEPVKIGKKLYIYDMEGNIIEKPKLGIGLSICLFFGLIFAIFPILWVIIPAIFVGICFGFDRSGTALGLGIGHFIVWSIGATLFFSKDTNLGLISIVILIVYFIILRNIFNSLPIKRVKFRWSKFTLSFIVSFFIYVIIFTVIRLSSL